MNFQAVMLEEKIRLHRPAAMPTLRLNLGCGTNWMDGGVVNIDCRNLLPPGGQGLVHRRARPRRPVPSTHS